MTVADALKIILANSYAVYPRPRTFTGMSPLGPYFRDYHLLLDRASRGRSSLLPMLWLSAPGRPVMTTIRSIGDIARHQTIKDNDAEFVTPQDMLAELRADNLHMVESLRRARTSPTRRRTMRPPAWIDTWTDEAERRAWFLFEVSR